MEPRIRKRLNSYLSNITCLANRVGRAARALRTRRYAKKWKVGNLLLISTMTASAVWAGGPILGDGGLRVCTLQVCFTTEEYKDEHECANGCYFEKNALDVSPKAQCEKLAESEGKYSYMYLDTVNKVTVGIGNQLPDADAAVELPFMIEEDGKIRAATDQEIRDGFNGLPVQPAGCDSETKEGRAKCRSAKYYEPFNKLRLEVSVVESLCRTRVETDFIAGLRGLFKDYDTFPSRVKAAMLDIVYNVGVGGFSAAEWPSFHRAVAARDWQWAADESKRGQVQPERNKFVKELLEEAARQENDGKRRLAQCPPPGLGSWGDNLGVK